MAHGAYINIPNFSKERSSMAMPGYRKGVLPKFRRYTECDWRDVVSRECGDSRERAIHIPHLAAEEIGNEVRDVLACR